MADYKVSYKVLKQQGDELKAVAKLVDGYAERVSQINGKLGSDEMLAEIRKNLSKLREQLGESRTVLSAAGEFLSKTVDSYTGVELRQVKKVDGTRAHNRDFYKNPSVVASAGGAAGAGVSAAGAAGATTTTTTANTVNFTDNSVNTTYNSPGTAAVPLQHTQTVTAASAAQSAGPVVSPVNAASPAAASSPVTAAAPVSGNGMSTAAKAAVGAGGAAVGAGGAAVAAGGVIGGLELKKRRDAKKNAGQRERADSDDYDPEAELQKAIARVRELEEDEG